MASLNEMWNIRVEGKVQGVWFRKHTLETALQMGIRGWVRNELDGSVAIAAEGTKDQLEAFVLWCRRGAPLAVVQRVAVTIAKPQGFQDFKII